MSPLSRNRLARHVAVTRWRAARLDPVLRGLLWSGAAGLLFTVLNTIMRQLSLELTPYQTQFLRYFMGLMVFVPLLWRHGLGAWRPRSMRGQFSRGALHTAGLSLWFLAVPHITLADTTAIGFTTPIFIMLGAALFLREPMHGARWVAAGLGLAGVLLVVGPQVAGRGGGYLLVMLASAPVFAGSFLMTKALTRYEQPTVIVVWQSITVSALSLPLALPGWQWPTATQWALCVVCGMLGSAGHYCLTRSYSVTDISATQSIKFLELVWATALGWLVFGDVPSQWTLAGGAVICASTVWIARREARGALAR